MLDTFTILKGDYSMLVRQKRFIALMMVCVLLASMIVLPIGDAKDKDKKTGRLAELWLIYTALEDALSGINRLIALITKDLERMEDALEDTNDELLELYPKRDKKEKQLEENQDELNRLLAEKAAAKKKRSNAKSRIRTLKREIYLLESEFSRTSPSDSEGRAALQAQLRQKRSELAQAKQDVKDADKIINSLWRGAKITFYKAVIGDAFSGLTRDLGNLNYRIGSLERIADDLNREIVKKKEKKEAVQTRRNKKQEEVDKARADYEKEKKQDELRNER